jgi:hypothetical protein
LSALQARIERYRRGLAAGIPPVRPRIDRAAAVGDGESARMVPIIGGGRGGAIPGTRPDQRRLR